MSHKPSGLGRERWENLRSEMTKRQSSKEQAVEMLKTHSKEMEKKMAHDVNRVQSIQDKITDVDLSGKAVISNYILEKNPVSGEPFRRYKFDSMADYADWKEKNDKYYLKKLKSRLTPH